MPGLPDIPRIIYLSDGRVEDRRWVFGPGDRIAITKGEYARQTGTVDTLVGMVKLDGRWKPMPGYNAKLDTGQWITVQWNYVEAE
ncbi:MAG: hypothetical protein QGI09_08520 [Dehalococcoidia bacterium]|nr:hypothetical protein [Dehalococcoidia bacterium]